MLYYDGAFYESVRKTYKSLYQRYSEQKVEGLIRTLLNNYRTKDDATLRSQLTAEQYAVTQKNATEPPFRNKI
jgi:hypothetical protein